MEGVGGGLPPTRWMSGRAMPYLIDTALKRVRRRFWKRCIIAAVLITPLGWCSASINGTPVQVLFPAAIVLLYAAVARWTFHRDDPAVQAEAERIFLGTRCAECGYDLKGLRVPGTPCRCPECGHEQPT
jgi:hypothetical protein